MVTGGTGFIGSHTSLLLLEKGYELVIVDSYINSSCKSIENVLKILGKKFNNLENKVKLFNLDLRNKNKIDEIFLNAELSGKPIDGVIHFAGLKSVPESISQPLDYWDSNLISTIHLLQVMDKYNCKTMVYSSSANIYQQNEDKKLNEKHQISPSNPYGKTKFVIEQLLEDVFDFSENWKIANLRYFNPIGAHDSGLIGEDPIGIPNNIYPTLTQVAIGKIKKFHIYGNDWPTRDGTALRDYIHVMDLAEGHLLVYEYLFKNNPQIIKLNLGTGKGTTVLELVSTFKKVNNVEIPYVFDKRREGDYGVVVADNSLASSLLDWTPQRTIEDMCKDGWRWQEKNPYGYI